MKQVKLKEIFYKYIYQNYTFKNKIKNTIKLNKNKYLKFVII